MLQESIPTLEEFTVSWITERLTDKNRENISEGKMSARDLQKSIRALVLQKGLLDMYTAKHGRQVMIEDKTITNLVTGVAKRMRELCKKSS